MKIFNSFALLFLFLQIISIHCDLKKFPKHVHLSLGKEKGSYRVMWLTEEYTESYAYYGTEQDAYQETAKGITNKLQYGDGFIHLVEFGKIEQGKRYFYRVGDSILKSKEFYFESKNNNLGDFKFIAFGDMGVTFKNSLV